jgi:hypothetical protein
MDGGGIFRLVAIATFFPIRMVVGRRMRMVRNATGSLEASNEPAATVVFVVSARGGSGSWRGFRIDD